MKRGQPLYSRRARAKCATDRDCALGEVPRGIQVKNRERTCNNGEGPAAAVINVQD
jgi:hypothetical protein